MLVRRLLAAGGFAAAMFALSTANAWADDTSTTDQPPPPPTITPIPCEVTVDLIVNIPTCFHIPGVGTLAIDNTYGLSPAHYGYGVEFIGDAGISFEAISEGSAAGFRSTIALETPLGSVSNAQSYGTSYAGATGSCIICNTFEVTGPPALGRPNIVTADTDITTGGLPTVDIKTPLGNVDF